MKKELSTYYFARFQGFSEMAEGIKVTATSEQEAITAATALLDQDGHRYRLVLRKVEEGCIG